MEYRDYYKTLGVGKDATDKEIKRAFRKLARQYHPDVNQGNKQAEEHFKEINEAYEVLSDPTKRQKYDQLGADWSRWQQQGQPGNFDWNQWTSTPGGGGYYGSAEDLEEMLRGSGAFSDFFSQIFGDIGGGRSRGGQRPGYRFEQPAQRGRDQVQEVEISLQEAYEGASRLLVRDGQQRTLRIPAGARTGTRIRFAGEGNPGVGAAAGDLYLKVKVLDDPRFERKGNDLYTTADVDLYTAMLGGKVPVDALGGRLMLTIQPETQNGRTMRLRGKGMPALRREGEYGDLYVKINVQLPAHLNERQRELLEEMRQAG